LPHAGAGAGAYRNWGKDLPAGIQACPVQLPGREHRQAEAPFSEVRPLVAQLAHAVEAAVKPPYAVFGHSAGALAAFELAREIRRLGGGEPVHLFVAGRPAPHIPLQQTRLAELSVNDLASVLRRLGGTPEEMLADHEFLKLMQPLLSADFALNEAYDYQFEPPLDIPITALAATDDDLVDVGLMAAWEEHTRAGFQLRTFSGGHFAVLQRQSEVLACIAEALRDH